MSSLRPVVLSGGSGTRLWPLSTKDAPKQFANLLPGGSLFERTVRRLHGRPGVSSPIVVTGASHLDHVTTALRDAGVTPHAILVEPEGRNTAPACIAAALVCDADDVLVVVPSDHLIRDTEGYVRAVEAAAAQAREGDIVTFGIQPTGPETGFGYIEMGEEVGPGRRVLRFKEKPDLAEAQHLVEDGRHVWNSGMFVLTVGTLVEEAKTHCPDILAAVSASMRPDDSLTERLGPAFAEAESISFDHAVMEKTDRAVVVPIDVGWDDIGSFESLWAVSEKDEDGNVLVGDVTAVDVTNSLIRATSRAVAVAGMDGVVVAETDGSVVVVARSQSQLVKELVERCGAG